ncbi:MAG: uracil phosphoribosyltransferase [Patescibacteria group bacterium]
MPFTPVDHPVIEAAMARLRDKRTPCDQIRRECHRVSLVLAEAATKSLPTAPMSIQTVLGTAHCKTLFGETVLVPIMRAGDGMKEAFLTFLPDSLVCHVSISRDHETHAPIFRGSTVPPTVNPEHTYFVLDPMLATGGSASHAIAHLKHAGATKIIFVGILGCPTGIVRLERDHPDVQVYIANIDPELNADAYIVPGLGDMGDRLFPTC